METLIPEICRLLNDTLSPENALVSSATVCLDRLSGTPQFPFALLSIATGGDGQGVRMAAATYLKNLTRRYLDGDFPFPEIYREFRNQLGQAVLQAEPAILKVLIGAFYQIVNNDFAKKNSWPELVPELKSVIQNSNFISQSSNSQWNTVNALTAVQTITRPFQYFMNPKVLKEPVPLQLELISENILVPLNATFHHFVEKALSSPNKIQVEVEQVLLIICKCMYFSVRSYMPSALKQVLPSFCRDLLQILESLNFVCTSSEDGYVLRLKTAKRSLIIFCALITRHRKHIDKLMPSVIDCALKISKQSLHISELDFRSERIVSLAFDVMSHVLETGPGWRLVSPRFSSILDSAIFPALAMNKKDISEWEEDPEEYLRKNLPSELGEISEDFFTARKSAINLLGVIAMSKGPPVVSPSHKRKKNDKGKKKEHQRSVGELLVIPFLSKFPIPSDGGEAPPKILQDYYGVLMAYGCLQDFLKERNSEYTTMLVRNRVLPLYSFCSCSPYLIATANWVLGELASCLPEDMSTAIYSSLLKPLSTPDIGDINCYPVRSSAAGAIAAFLQNDYVPPDWLALLQVLVERLDSGDENESLLLFQLLRTVVETGQEKVAVHIPVTVSRVASTILKHLPPIPEPWPQVVEHGFAALAAMAQTWEDCMPDEVKELKSTEWGSGWVAIVRTFSELLQQAWLIPRQPMEEVDPGTLPPLSCFPDASALLGSVMRFITAINEATELKILELLTVWADLIADWHAWEEMEDLAIFESIRDIISLQSRCDFLNFFVTKMPSQISYHSSPCSIMEGIAAFVREGIGAYPSATWRACSCVHLLLHSPRFSSDTEVVKQSIAVAFAHAAFSHFSSISNKPVGLWKPLLLAISSCYVSYPEMIEQVLEKDGNKAFVLWAHGLAHLSSSSFQPGLTLESEIKLAVLTLVKVIERLLGAPLYEESGVLKECFVSLMEACIRLREVQDEEDEIGTDTDNEASEEETDDEYDDEDSEDEEREQTEEEFLDRYSKAVEELENEMVSEDFPEDEAHELELGPLDDVDIQKNVVLLVERHRHFLLQGQAFPSSLIQDLLKTYPEYGTFLQVSS